jgi:hypothetical protein
MDTPRESRRPLLTPLGWALTAALLAVSAGAGWWASRPAAVPLPPLVLLGNDLGEMRVGEATRRTVVVENRSGSVVEVKRFHGDCRCASFVPEQVTLPPNGKAEVEVTVKLEEEGRERFDLLMLADAEKGGVEILGKWTLKGRIVRDAELSTWYVDFGVLTEGQLGKAVRTVPVKLKAKGVLRSLEARSKSPAFEAAVSGLDVVVKAVKPLPQGQPFGEVVVKVTLGEREPVELLLRAKSLVLSDIEAVPERILVGRRMVGTRGVEEVLLASRTGKRLTVVALGADGAGLAVEKVEDDTGKGARLRLAYEVAREGQDERAVWADVRQGDEPGVRRVRVVVQSLGYREEGKP